MGFLVGQTWTAEFGSLQGFRYWWAGAAVLILLALQGGGDGK